jgi:hypothetical protein
MHAALPLNELSAARLPARLPTLATATAGLSSARITARALALTASRRLVVVIALIRLPTLCIPLSGFLLSIGLIRHGNLRLKVSSCRSILLDGYSLRLDFT